MIQWQPDLATGNPEIDAHHREMFDKINELISACKQRHEKTAVLELLAFLNRYIYSHFEAEERFLETLGTPRSHEHIKQHRELKTSLETLIAECTKDGVTLPVVANSLKLTYLWLRDHIMQLDREMVAAQNGCRP